MRTSAGGCSGSACPVASCTYRWAGLPKSARYGRQEQVQTRLKSTCRRATRETRWVKLRTAVTRPFCHVPPITSQSGQISARGEPNRRSGTLAVVTMRALQASSPEFELTRGGAFGIYVHVPFCATRCGYCDFNTYTPGRPAARRPRAGSRRCGWVGAGRAAAARPGGRHRVRRRRDAVAAGRGRSGRGARRGARRVHPGQDGGGHHRGQPGVDGAGVLRRDPGRRIHPRVPRHAVGGPGGAAGAGPDAFPGPRVGGRGGRRGPRASTTSTSTSSTAHPAKPTTTCAAR